MCYIDGFNLYHGMREAKFKRFYWLDLVALAKSLCDPGSTLVGCKYFTSRVRGGRPSDPPRTAAARNGSQRRQKLYLEALASIPQLSIFYGKFLESRVEDCRVCNSQRWKTEEKMSDVNAATEMLVDACQGSFDTAMVVSGDTDLVPPMLKLMHFYGKRCIAVFPPHRPNADLKQKMSGYLHINHTMLQACQLPDPVVLKSGVQLSKPTEWV